jgi:membrane-associated PAP2 superfamily phosphatase
MRFNSLASTAAIALAVAGLAGLSGVAQAESNLGSASASASLDFQVVIPGLVFLQVGTGAFQEDDTNVDEIVFDVQPAQLVSGGSVAATAESGNLGNGRVDVRVWGNIGSLQLSSSALTKLTDAAGNEIPWSEITVATFGGNAPEHGLFDADGNMSVTLTAPGQSKVVNRVGTWTYSYANNAANSEQLSEGTYSGTVTYTVANP